MIYQIMEILSLLTIAVACLITLRFVITRPLKPFARNLLIVLIFCEIILGVLDIYAFHNHGLPAFWDWFFDLQYEMNLGSIFSTVQLFTVCLVIYIVAMRTPDLRLWQRLYLLGLSAIFLYLSLDEFYTFHETFGNGRVVSENWRLPYAIAGGGLFLGTIGAYWFGFRNELRLFIMMFMGLLVMAISGIGLEDFAMHGWVDSDPNMGWMYVFEEVGEMIGATIILTGFLSYAQEHMTPPRWNFSKRFIVGGTLLWTAWLFFDLLLFPSFEARFLATPIDVEYENGKISLVGYSLTPDVVHPGDEVKLTLYWRANEPLNEDYALSLHALSHPSIDSLAQLDELHMGPIPSEAWFPGVVMRRSVYLQLPKNLPTPASYWLMMRIWFGPWPLGRPWQDTTGVVITESPDRALISDNAVILDHLAALPARDDSQPPAQTATYNFPNEGFTLSGMQLPADTVTDHTLPISFWWQTKAKGQTALQQFFHLVPENGDQVYSFDQQPFNGSFPTDDWPADMKAADQWHITLPDDLPAGTYKVVTGLYNLQTMTRSTVVDSSGQELPNDEIQLGTLVYAPSGTSAAGDATAQAVLPVCYGIADADMLRNGEDDTLAAMNMDTGEASEVGQTGTFHAEALTFSADRTALYTIDEMEQTGQFGVIDPATGQFTPVGTGVVSVENPARNPIIGMDTLKDVDSMSVDPRNGELWAANQDHQNKLFRVDPETGEIMRDFFGDGYDYMQINLTKLPGPTEYTQVEDMVIDPTNGTFYVIASNDEHDGVLARLDFDTLSLETGQIDAVMLNPFVSASDGARILDMEGLSLAEDGTLYAASTNNSNVEANYDMIWKVDAATGSSTPVGRYADYVDYVDYEGIACRAGTNSGA
jgi:hypothetical protein